MSNPNPILKPAPPAPAPATKAASGRQTRRRGRSSPDSTRPWHQPVHSTHSIRSYASRSTGAYAFPAGRRGSSKLIAVSGEIDLSTAEALYQRLKALAGPPPRRISLDLSRVTFIDCAGLHVLDSMARLVHENDGTLDIGPVSRVVARLFELADWHPSGRA